MQGSLQLEAMNAPADLWVVPLPRHSRWFTHLDWYFNWQMCKGLAYAGLHLPSETYRVAEEFGVPIPKPFTPDAPSPNAEYPLLISCMGKVPAAKCLVLGGAGQLKDWLNTARETAEGLQAEVVRVFLPTGVSVKEAEKAWKKTGINVHFSADLSTDLESAT